MTTRGHHGLLLNGNDGGGGDGSPSILSYTAGRSDSGTVKNMSPPVDTEAGDLLLLLFAYDSTPSVSITGGDWSFVTFANTGAERLGLYKKVATGSDAIQLTLSSSQATAWLLLRIAAAVDCSATAFSNVDPPEHIPAGGENAYLWIPAVVGRGQQIATAPPTNYENLMTQQASTDTSEYVSVSAASRDLTAASENPGVFTGISNGASMTIAVWS